MNERIRELVKKAGGEFWQRLENDVVNPEAFVTFDPPQSLEKFAELIVKDVFAMIKEACLEGDDSKTDEIIDDRLQDAASDVVDVYGIVDRIY